MYVDVADDAALVDDDDGALAVAFVLFVHAVLPGDFAFGMEVREQRVLRDPAEGLAEARSAVAALRDEVPPLPDAITDLVQGFRRDHQVDAEFTVEGQARSISSGATVSLLRTAREALTNAAKHAPGAPVAVLLTYHATLVRLVVSNSAPTLPVIRMDGVSGYGLTGMRERLALVGGTLVAGPFASGDGWQVVAEIGES